MNLLFEQFVSQLLEDGLTGTGVRVHRQRRDSSILFDELRSRSYASVIPDVVLERTQLRGSRQVVPIDVKYKPYDSRRVDSSDIYQTFLYAFAYRGDALPAPVAIIYPRETTGAGFRLVVRDTQKIPGYDYTASRSTYPTPWTLSPQVETPVNSSPRFPPCSFKTEPSSSAPHRLRSRVPGPASTLGGAATPRSSEPQVAETRGHPLMPFGAA